MGTSNRKSRTGIIVVILIVLVGAGIAGGIYYKKREKPIVVQTEKVARRNLIETVVATGKIQPVTQVLINPEVSGEIVELPVEEGQSVKRGDVLVKIKADIYQANLSSAEASYQSALANVNLAKANLEKAKLEFDRIYQLFTGKLVSDSEYLTAKTTLDVAKATYENSQHQAVQVSALVKSRKDELAKTTIVAPIDGTVARLKSEVGERVVGSSMMQGTDIMTIANLHEMEARVEIGEVDIVLIKIGQKARLDVDSFKDRKFTGIVREIAHAAKTTAQGMQQEATKFEVKILLQEKEVFRPGMSVTADVETRYRTNVLTAPIQSVTTRLPDSGKKDKKQKELEAKQAKEAEDEGLIKSDKRKTDPAHKSVKVVFGVADGLAKMFKIQDGVSDDNYVEILEGLTDGQEVISGGFKAISRELEDGKKVKVDNTKKPGLTTEKK